MNRRIMILYRVMQIIMAIVICYFIYAAIEKAMSTVQFVVFTSNAVAIILACEVGIRNTRNNDQAKN